MVNTQFNEVKQQKWDTRATAYSHTWKTDLMHAPIADPCCESVYIPSEAVDVFAVSDDQALSLIH